MAVARRWAAPSLTLTGSWPAPPTSPAERSDRLTIDELLATYWRHAEQHYCDADGRPTDELGNMLDALRPLAELCGALPAAEFSPLKLKAVRQKMLDCRPPAGRPSGPQARNPVS